MPRISVADIEKSELVSSVGDGVTKVTMKNGKVYYVHRWAVFNAQDKGYKSVQASTTQSAVPTPTGPVKVPLVQEDTGFFGVKDEGAEPETEEGELPEVETPVAADVRADTGVILEDEGEEGGFKNKGDVLQYLRSLGVPLDDPSLSVDSWAIGIMQANPADQRALANNMVNGARENGTIRISPYESQLQQAGFLGPPDLPGPGEAGGTLAGMREGGLGIGRTDEATGSILRPDGVLMSPVGTGGEVLPVLDHTDPNMVGSQAWVVQAREDWDEQRLAQEKATLAKFGYLSKEEAKRPGWTTNTAQALMDYHYNVYAYGGPIGKGDAMGGAAAGKPQFPDFNFENLQARARAEAEATFMEIYQDKPTEQELERWSRAILNTATELYSAQRGVFNSGDDYLTRSEVYSEAAIRTGEEMRDTPAAGIAEERLGKIEENTTLKETLSRTASVIDAVMKGR